MDETEHNDIIREFVVSRVTLFADNSEPLHERLTAAAVDAVETETSFAWDRYEYAEALAGRNGDGLAALHDAVGAAVADALTEFVDSCREDAEENAGIALAILSELLDLSDRQQWVLFGRHYLPDVDDAFPEGEDDDAGWVTEQPDGSFTPIDVPRGWVPSAE